MTRSRTRRPADRLYGSAIAAGHAGMWLLWPYPAILMTVLDIALTVTAAASLPPGNDRDVVC